MAVPRPPKPQLGWRSVTTTDILKWKGKYYLYYQGFTEASGKRGDDCPVAVSYSDSPDGPWIAHGKVVIPNGPEGSWDQYSIHDPYPIVRNGKIYIYYKSDSNGQPNLVRMHGLAIGENPLGPFIKHELNPILSSGHETTVFPFKEGVAALVIRDGHEHNTIQYAKDGVNFEIASISEFLPMAAGPFIPDAFTNTSYGRGITWGISHFTAYNGWGKNHSIIARFDCDLSLDYNEPEIKKNHTYLPADIYFEMKLSKDLKEKILNRNIK